MILLSFTFSSLNTHYGEVMKNLTLVNFQLNQEYIFTLLPTFYQYACYFAGDRILAVNGQSLERVTHEHAVSVLKNVTSPVELKVSQSSFPISSLGML